MAAAAAWQCRQRWLWRGVSDSGGSLGVSQQWRQQRDYKTDNKAELMEENFGAEGEDEDTFGS